jgi:hypothetical protein
MRILNNKRYISSTVLVLNVENLEQHIKEQKNNGMNKWGHITIYPMKSIRAVHTGVNP